MKIDIDLPWGGKLHYEKKPKPPISEEARQDLMRGLVFLCCIGAMLILFWMFR